jgi:hypothetical protein
MGKTWQMCKMAAPPTPLAPVVRAAAVRVPEGIHELRHIDVLRPDAELVEVRERLLRAVLPHLPGPTTAVLGVLAHTKAPHRPDLLSRGRG